MLIDRRPTPYATIQPEKLGQDLVSLAALPEVSDEVSDLESEVLEEDLSDEASLLLLSLPSFAPSSGGALGRP